MINPLAPAFLVNNIELIGLVMGVMVLVIFDDFFCGKVIFPLADFVKTQVFEKLMSIKQVKEYKKATKYASEFLATAIFIAYCYLGYEILAGYIIVPILQRMQNIILLIVILIFFIVSYVLHRTSWRKRMYG